MLEWWRSWRARREQAVRPPQATERDSGEDEYETEEEIDQEVGPSGEPRVKTDGI